MSKTNTFMPEINKSKIENSILKEDLIEEKMGKSHLYGNLKEQEPVISEKEIDDNEKDSQIKSERIILQSKAQEKKIKFDGILASKQTKKNETYSFHFENKKDFCDKYQNVEFHSSESHIVREENNQINPI